MKPIIFQKCHKQHMSISSFDEIGIFVKLSELQKGISTCKPSKTLYEPAIFSLKRLLSGSMGTLLLDKLRVNFI